MIWAGYIPLSSVKARPGACPCVVRNPNPKHDGVGEDNRAEGKRVCADGGDQDNRVIGMREGATRGHVVGC